MTLTPKKLMEGVEIIVKGSSEGGQNVVNETEKYFEGNPWPINFSKDDAIQAIQYLLDEELPVDPAAMFTDLMSARTRTMPKLSDEGKELLEKLKVVIRDAKGIECKHENLGLAPFYHGGGFSPTFAAPELICTTCGLNVTLFSGIKPHKYGLKISKKNLEVINTWAKECDEAQRSGGDRVHSSNMITENPIKAYDKSIKWDGPIPLKIDKPKVLESMSGK